MKLDNEAEGGWNAVLKSFELHLIPNNERLSSRKGRSDLPGSMLASSWQITERS